MRIVLWLGGIIPTVVLLGLLAYSLPYMRPRPASPADLTIAVDGEQFWWRVAYAPPGRPPVLSANEIRIPTGRTVAFRLSGGDVVHSFWIPGLAGKMDMIPGRINSLVVRADKPGRYRGQCAEFCGLSHALMAFDVIAMPPPPSTPGWPSRPAPPNRATRPERACSPRMAVADATVSRGQRAQQDRPRSHPFRIASYVGGGHPADDQGERRRLHPPSRKDQTRCPHAVLPQLSDDEALALARYLQGLK